MAERVIVSSRNQIAVPSAVRKRLGIKSGDRLLVELRDGYAILMPEPDDYATELRGLHADVWLREDAQEYVNRERDAWQG
jgi:AbrB family looped-hinge helix DNA binding protein